MPRSIQPLEEQLTAKKNLSVSLIRGLAILESFSAEQPMLGITDLADKLELNKSTVQRYVNTLKTLGYLEQDEERKKYCLGIRVIDLGSAVLEGMELRQIALPYLEELSANLGETVSISVLDGTEIVYLERVRTKKIIDVDLHVGARLPTYCTSMGKVLLAHLPEAELEKVLGRVHFEKHGPNTITDREQLLKELHQVRAKGFAINDEELARGLRSVAVPIRSRGCVVVAAMNMALHASKILTADVEPQLVPHLLATAEKISRKLGCWHR